MAKKGEKINMHATEKTGEKPFCLCRKSSAIQEEKSVHEVHGGEKRIKEKRTRDLVPREGKQKNAELSTPWVGWPPRKKNNWPD